MYISKRDQDYYRQVVSYIKGGVLAVVEAPQLPALEMWIKREGKR